MDGFGDSFVPPVEGTAPAPEVDPAAEFLAREQDQLAGLDDVIIPPAAQVPAEPQPATGEESWLTTYTALVDKAIIFNELLRFLHLPFY